MRGNLDGDRLFAKKTRARIDSSFALMLYSQEAQSVRNGYNDVFVRDRKTSRRIEDRGRDAFGFRPPGEIRSDRPGHEPAAALGLVAEKTMQLHRDWTSCLPLRKASVRNTRERALSRSSLASG